MPLIISIEITSSILGAMPVASTRNESLVRSGVTVNEVSEPSELAVVIGT